MLFNDKHPLDFYLIKYKYIPIFSKDYLSFPNPNFPYDLNDTITYLRLNPSLSGPEECLQAQSKLGPSPPARRPCPGAERHRAAVTACRSQNQMSPDSEPAGPCCSCVDMTWLGSVLTPGLGCKLSKVGSRGVRQSLLLFVSF